MDGTLAIEHNRQALQRILLTLVAMAGLSTRATLPRHLRNAVLRLLRPAEAAARRLVIALARGMTAPPPHPRKPDLPQTRKHRPVMPPEPRVRAPLRGLALPLIDLLPPIARRIKRPKILPRICVPGVTVRLPVIVRLPPSPHDQLDATRLGLRLDALGRALDDLPRQALRFARWQSRQKRLHETDKARRRWPLRMGPPPGSRNPRPAHPVHDVLRHAHALAFWALENPDTS